MYMECTDNEGVTHMSLTVGKRYPVRLMAKNDMGKPRILVREDDNGKKGHTRAYRFKHTSPPVPA